MTGSNPEDMWELAQENSEVLRLSTLFTARQVNRYLAEEDGVQRAIEWCRGMGITHVYLESFRSEFVPPDDALRRGREKFREAGFIVSGCMTPSNYGKHGTGWRPFSCYTAEETRRKLREMSRNAARFFDVVMIDDFLASDCTCPDCRAAKGDRPWSEFKRELMLELSRTHIIEAGKEVNPDVEFIIKYPGWHEMYQERGYDVDAQSHLFPRTWVGTETRGIVPSERREDTRDSRLSREPQYRAFWLMRWLKGIAGQKCGGGWYDAIVTSPTFYLEQGRQTILGGALEALLFNFGGLYEGSRGHQGYGPADAEALRGELPEQFALARLIHGKRPRGLAAWKPPNSLPGPDWNLHLLLGMAGFPVTAAHEFDPQAGGFIFSYHALHDPAWWDAVECVLDGDRAVVASRAFLETVRPLARGNRLDLDALEDRAVVPPEPAERDTWPAAEQMAPAELDALRDRACEELGVRFHAPNRVSLHLFGDDVAVVESFRDEPLACQLSIRGWCGFDPAVRMPADGEFEVTEAPEAKLYLPPRSLLALRRS